MAFRQAMVSAYRGRERGVTLPAFAKQNGLAPSTLKWWVSNTTTTNDLTSNGEVSITPHNQNEIYKRGEIHKPTMQPVLSQHPLQLQTG